MSSLSLIFKEIGHRKINFLLSLLAVVTAVALFIAFFTAGKASNRETARLMLTMGYNLHIISRGTDMNEFLLTGIPDKTMPEQYLEKLRWQEKISYNHLMATLQRKILWRGQEVILTGLSAEVWPPGKKKPPISYQIKPGEAYIGYRVAKKLGLAEGSQVKIKQTSLKVAKCLAEAGDIDDIRIQCNLSDAQEILNLPGQISEIRAVDCLCFAPTDNPVLTLRKEVSSLLPDAQVFHLKSIAETRAKTRQMVKKLFAVIIPFVVIVCGVWIGILAILNVRDRQPEIGIMRALGYGWGKISVLCLGRALIVGLLGAIIGFLIGTALAWGFGADIFKLTARTIIKPEWFLLVVSVIFAPLFAAVSSFIPAMIAVTYDPAVILRKE